MKLLQILVLLLAGSYVGTAGETNVTRSCCARSTETPKTSTATLSGTSVYQLDSTWTSDHGSAVKLSSLQGRPQVVAMFFANCAYACPLLVFQMQQIEESLPASLRDKVGFTLVSFDPERDTVDRLHQYRLQHSLAEGRWTLLRGNADDVQDLAALLNVKFKKDAQGQFTHSNVLTLLNADGEIVSQQVGLTLDREPMIRQATALAQN